MYSFIDVDEYQRGKNLPSEAMSINGKYIENEIEGYRTLQVEGRELLETEVSDFQIGFQSGSKYQDKRDPVRVITVHYSLKADSPASFREKFNKLTSLLDQEQAKLIFNDEPDKYFIGTKSDVDSVDPGLLSVKSSFSFYCADPYKYSNQVKTAKNNGGKTITLVNTGNKPVPITVKAKMKSENGYIGMILEDRFYQVGNPGEVDGETKEKSVKLFDDHFTQDRGWILNNGVTPPVTHERLQVGTVGYTTENPSQNEGFVKATAYGTGNSWHGPSLTKMIPSTSGGLPTNWRAEWRFDLNTDGSPNKPVEVGHNSVTFADENDNVICSVVFEDNNPVAERSDMAIYIDNKRVWDTRETTNFYVTGRNDGGPFMVVEKIGSKITVAFSKDGLQKTFFTNKPNAKLKKVTWYCAAYQGRRAITNNNIRALNVTKHNVKYYYDIPNFLQSGDVVELIGETNELFINDIKNWDRVDIGSEVLLLPPGEHALGIAVSEFATMPDVEVTYRERWG